MQVVDENGYAVDDILKGWGAHAHLADRETGPV